MSQRRSTRAGGPPQTAPAPPVEDMDDDSNSTEEVNECARYILCREGSKIPIKRAEIAKHLATVCQTPSGNVSRVILRTERLLEKVYGYKLVHVSGKAMSQYIVVLKEECESLPSSISDSQQRVLLMAALTHIFMSGGNVKEEDMWSFLSEAGLLDANDFAGRKNFSSTFTRQLYLTVNKVGEGEFTKNVFEWGRRATEEVPKLFVLNKMAEAFEKTPDHWSEQFRQANEEAQQRS